MRRWKGATSRLTVKIPEDDREQNRYDCVALCPRSRPWLYRNVDTMLLKLEGYYPSIIRFRKSGRGNGGRKIEAERLEERKNKNEESNLKKKERRGWARTCFQMETSPTRWSSIVTPHTVLSYFLESFLACS